MVRAWPRHCSCLALVLAMGGAAAESAAPPVALVQPSAAEIPANLLRISIRFAAPVDEPVLSRIGLRRADGSPIEQPFLQQELWSPDGTILTFLLHPGRIKSGLLAHEELGPILVPGENVELTLDGRPIRKWHVAAEDRSGPVVSAWKLSRVRVRSTQPLVVSLDAPIDGRDAADLAIADADGRRVAGRATLMRGESVWTFTPASYWRQGSYRLRVRGTLEDPAGNRVDGQFEWPLGSRAEAAPTDREVAFDVR